MKVIIYLFGFVGFLSAAHADQSSLHIWNELTQAPRAEDVEDDGGFEHPFYIEGDYKEGEAPVVLEPDSQELLDFLHKDLEVGEGEIWQTLLLPSNNEVATRCSVSTKKCEPAQRKGSIEIFVDLNGNRQGQSMTVVADGRNLWSNPISSGVRGYRTETGSYQLKYTNAGRVTYTRNHCSSIKDYGSVKGGVINLAPMPYAIHFNGGEAFHAGYVTGSPQSHGCIRQPVEYARKLYCLISSQKNWARTTVHVY